MEREKYRAKNGSLRNTSTDSKGTTCAILKNHTVGKVRRGGRRASIERRRECTDLGLDLDEREEQVVCHASALAMIDEAHREAEM